MDVVSLFCVICPGEKDENTQSPTCCGTGKSMIELHAPGSRFTTMSCGHTRLHGEGGTNCANVSISVSLCGAAPKPSPWLLSVTTNGPVWPAGILTVTVKATGEVLNAPHPVRVKAPSHG